MRILFLESNEIWIYGLPNEFVDNGHTVMISGLLTKKNIPKIINEFKPDMAITIGRGVKNTSIKQQWIRKYMHEAKVPLVYWAVEDSEYTKTWSLPLIKNIQADFVFTHSPTKVKYYNQNGINSAVMDFGYHTRKAISEQAKISVKDHMYSNRAEYMLKVLFDHGIIKCDIVGSSEQGEIYYYENYTNDKYQLHIVNPGDTLWGISKKYKVLLSELIKLNNLTSSEILVDQVLKIKEITNPESYLHTIFKSLDINNIPGGADAARWAKDIVTASEKYQIPSSLLYAIMVIESRGNPSLVSSSGGIGLMQFHIKTANWLDINPCDPLHSIDGAARYLKELNEEFHDWKLAVAAYNAGPDKVQKYNGIPPMEEPQNYVNEVFSFIEALLQRFTRI